MQRDIALWRDRSFLSAPLPRMLCHLSVIRSCADYRMRSVPAVGGRPYGGRANAFPPLGSSMLSCLAAFVGLMAAMAFGIPCHGRCSLPALVPLLALLALCLFWLAVCFMCCSTLLLLLRSTCSVGTAASWPLALCRVWLAQLAAAPLGAAAEALQPMVPVAYYGLGGSWCEVLIEWPCDLTFCRCSSPSSRLNSVLFFSLTMITWIFVL